ICFLACFRFFTRIFTFASYITFRFSADEAASSLRSESFAVVVDPLSVRADFSCAVSATWVCCVCPFCVDCSFCSDAHPVNPTTTTRPANPMFHFLLIENPPFFPRSMVIDGNQKEKVARGG